jgi:hypothetical protein
MGSRILDRWSDVVVWIGSVAAVVTGHIGRREVRDRGYGGDTLAIIGLVLGYIGLGILATMIFFWFIGSIGNASVTR